MAITTRATLESAIDNWLARTDIASERKLEFIALFEAVANRRLRVRQMEASDDLTTSSGSVALPSDFNAVRSLTWSGSSDRVLDYYTPRLFRAMYPASEGVGQEGVPTIFTIEGETLVTKPTNDETDAFTLRYWSRLDALDADDATNWLLTDYPDCYLAGVLHEANSFLMNVQGAILWKSKRDEIFEEIIRDSNKSMGPMAIRPIGHIV
jgi:hypothetical protein